MSGYARIPRELWPAIVSAFSKPWMEEWVAADLEYWRGEAERESKGYRSELPLRGKRKIKAPYCAERWGWTVHHARKALRRARPMCIFDRETIEKRSKNDSRNEQAKPENGGKPFKNDRETIEKRSRSLTTRARLQTSTSTSTTDVPPLPPMGDLERAVWEILEADPWRLSEDEWWSSAHPRRHGYWDVYCLSLDHDDPEMSRSFREEILRSRPAEPMTPADVLGALLASGWTGTKRLRDIERAVKSCNFNRHNSHVAVSR